MRIDLSEKSWNHREVSRSNSQDSILYEIGPTNRWTYQPFHVSIFGPVSLMALALHPRSPEMSSSLWQPGAILAAQTPHAWRKRSVGTWKAGKSTTGPDSLQFDLDTLKYHQSTIGWEVLLKRAKDGGTQNSIHLGKDLNCSEKSFHLTSLWLSYIYTYKIRQVCKCMHMQTSCYDYLIPL